MPEYNTLIFVGGVEGRISPSTKEKYATIYPFQKEKLMDVVPPLIRQAFRDLLAESATPPPALTPRRVFGPVWMPAKATAVIGMRRVGKTTFVHQLREQRRAQGVSAQRLPCASFGWSPSPNASAG